MSGHIAGDELAQDRNRVLDRLFDAIRRPGESGVDRADRALGVGCAVELDVFDAELQLHPLGVLDLVARGLDRDVGVVVGQYLPRHQRRHPERRGGLVFDLACRCCCDLVIRLVTDVQLYADRPGDDDGDHDDEDQQDRQRVAKSALLFLYLGGLVCRRGHRSGLANSRTGWGLVDSPRVRGGAHGEVLGRLRRGRRLEPGSPGITGMQSPVGGATRGRGSAEWALVARTSPIWWVVSGSLRSRHPSDSALSA